MANTPVRVVSRVRRCNHITPVLEDPRRLPVSQRVMLSKTALFISLEVCQCVSPAYLSDLCLLTSGRQLLRYYVQFISRGVARNFLLGGCSPGGLRDGGRKSLSEVQGQSPGRGSGGQCLPEAEAVCRHCLHILTAKTIKI